MTDYRALSDADLVAMFQSGDTGASNELCCRYRENVQRYCRYLIRDHESARDAAQETCWTRSQTWSTSVISRSLASSGDDVFAGTQVDGIYHSTDNGTTWMQNVPGVGKQFVISIRAAGDTIVAGTLSGVFRSFDRGATWTKATGNQYFVNAVLFTHSTFFAGAWSSGVILSADAGNTWKPSNEGLPVGCSVMSLAVDPVRELLVIGTVGGPVFTRPLSEMVTTTHVAGEVPAAGRLFQNYPNPFNATTTITYEIPPGSLRSAAGDVKLTLLDILGREVLVLVHARMNPGSYSVQLNGSDLASGVYLYRLQAGDLVQSRKLILLK